MLPPETTWPPKRLMPSRCPCESRPFTEEPPPFLCAIRKTSIQFDVADFHRGERLTMAARDFVLSAALVLQDETLVATSMRNDFACDFGFAGARSGHDFFAVLVDGQYLIKRHFAADFSVELFDPHRFPGRDAVLLASTANHGVHESSKAACGNVHYTDAVHFRQCRASGPSPSHSAQSASPVPVE